MPGDGGNAVVSANALSNYSYVNSRYNGHQGTQIVRCVTGLGPSGNDSNTALGKCYFNGTRIPFVECSDSSSAIVQPRVAVNWAGVINIVECRNFSTDAEGVYTCMIMNSSMIYESIKFGIYFAKRSELLDFHFQSPNPLSSYCIAAPVMSIPSSSTVIVAIGSLLTLSCISQGSPPDTFTWRKDNDPTVLQSTSITAVNYTNTSAVFRADYSIDNVTTSDSGTYTCNITNPIGSDSATITVVVNCKFFVNIINDNKDIAP